MLVEGGEGSMGGGEEFGEDEEEENSGASEDWGGESQGAVEGTVVSSPLRISVCLASFFSLLRRLEVSGGGELVGWGEGTVDLGEGEMTGVSSALRISV